METSKEKLFVFVFCIALFIVSIFPNIFKTLFIHHSGKFEVLGLGWALIIVIAILMKWKHTKLLFNIVFIITLLVEVLILFMSSQPYFINIALLMLSQFILLLVFNFSNVIQNRFQNKFSI